MSDLNFSDDSDDDFAAIDISTETYGENLNQGHGMYIGPRIKLAPLEMKQLKDIIDSEINPDLKQAPVQHFSVRTANMPGMRLNPDNEKLTNISVQIEGIESHPLVKVGPCDLSGVGGHLMRERMIKDLVEQALVDNGYDLAVHNFYTVNVSACVGVRGRAQMMLGFFANNREDAGTHMNAYVKTAGEAHVTHWEPRQGPQRFFDDTICAMVTSTTTSLFEKGIREGSIDSSAQATVDILKNPSLVTIFDELLSRTAERITKLIKDIKELVGIEDEPVNSSLKPD